MLAIQPLGATLFVLLLRTNSAFLLSNTAGDVTLHNCTDKLDNCDEYDGGNLCTDLTFHVWVLDNCQGYCGLHGCKEACDDNEFLPTCADINRPLNCSDASVARNCRRSCGFCSFDDGGWSEWGTWNGCDVTCGTGTRRHERTCTNPSPHYGLPCLGSNSETGVCTLSPCPGMTVNGVWSAWGLWESCSVTCDGGMQMRMRSCTSPDAGNHCPGKPSEHRVCSLQACQDGAWSSWERWNVCSITCGGGIKRRQRHCNNPPPSPSGRYCDGSSEQTLICNNNPCPVKDCRDIMKYSVGASSGVYTVYAPTTYTRVQVFCDLDTDGGGWTVFQKRFNGLVNFYRPFAEYEEGFGTVHGEFWLGLKWLHEFTAYGSFELRVDIETANGTTFSDHYRSFRVTEGSNYKVYLDRWDWSPGVTSNSSLSNMNRMSFSTYDHQTHHVAGNNCDLQYEPGWWYYSCYNANLNGKYLVPGTHSIVGMCYENYDGNQHESLKSSKMMFRRN